MNEEIRPYSELVPAYNVATDHGGLCPRSFAEELLEQIRLRDKKIVESPSILSAAIALSSGNKAKTTNSRGETIVVQEQFPGLAAWNLHVWVIAPDAGRVYETDFQFRQGHKLKDLYEVDPSAKIWASV